MKRRWVAEVERGVWGIRHLARGASADGKEGADESGGGLGLAWGASLEGGWLVGRGCHGGGVPGLRWYVQRCRLLLHRCCTCRSTLSGSRNLASTN